MFKVINIHVYINLGLVVLTTSQRSSKSWLLTWNLSIFLEQNDILIDDYLIDFVLNKFWKFK